MQELRAKSLMERFPCNLSFHPARGAQIKRYLSCARRPGLCLQMPHHRRGKHQNPTLAAPGHFIFKNNDFRIMSALFGSGRYLQLQTFLRARLFTIPACRTEFLNKNDSVDILLIVLDNRQGLLLTIQGAKTAAGTRFRVDHRENFLLCPAAPKQLPAAHLFTTNSHPDSPSSGGRESYFATPSPTLTLPLEGGGNCFSLTLMAAAARTAHSPAASPRQDGGSNFLRRRPAAAPGFSGR